MEEKHQCPNLIEALSKKITAPQKAVWDFYAMCPSFCDTPANWTVLTDYLAPEFDHELRWPTADELVVAYDTARRAGHFRVN